MKLLAEKSDGELIDLFLSGQLNAFDALLERHRKTIYSTIYYLIKDRELTNDILQDVLIKIINTLRQRRYNEKGKFLPWSLRIAHNHCLDHLRTMKRIPVLKAEYQERNPSFTYHEEGAETRMIQIQNDGYLKYLIDKLPEEQRTVILFRHFNEMSFKEIARHTNSSINTTLGRMRYGLIKLRRMMESKSAPD